MRFACSTKSSFNRETVRASGQVDRGGSSDGGSKTVIPHKDMLEFGEARENGYDVPDAIDPSSEHVVNVISAHVITIHQEPVECGDAAAKRRKHSAFSSMALSIPVMQDLKAGLGIKTLIPAEAVHLEAGICRLGKRRWNRWIGTIVRLDHQYGKKSWRSGFTTRRLR